MVNYPCQLPEPPGIGPYPPVLSVQSAYPRQLGCADQDHPTGPTLGAAMLLAVSGRGRRGSARGRVPAPRALSAALHR